MATYRSLAERQAAEGNEQQRMAELNPQGYAAGAVNPAATPPSDTPAPAATPAPAPAAPSPPPTAPLTATPAEGTQFQGSMPWNDSPGMQTFGDPGNAPPWLQQFSGGQPGGGDSAAPMQMGGPSAPSFQPRFANHYGSTQGGTPTPTASGGGGVSGTYIAPYEGASGVAQTSVDTSGMPAVQTGLNTSGLPAPQSGLNYGDLNPINTDFAGQAQRGADAAYQGATQFFDQDFGRDRAALENQLVNQGLQPGSEAFNNQMELMQRGQNAARENAGFMAQGVGHQQAGDLLMRALQTRQQGVAEQGQNAAMGLAARGQLTGEQGQNAAMNLASRGALMGERNQNADRLHQQSVDLANLGLAARGQSMGRDTALQSNATQAAAAANAANNARYGIDTQAQLGLRQLGLTQDNQDFQQLMQLLTQSRGGVNMPNFGSPQPLDVGGATQIASSNSNSQQNRDAQDRSGLYGLGAAALGSLGRTYFNGY